jgi:hypothetical protein
MSNLDKTSTGQASALLPLAFPGFAAFPGHAFAFGLWLPGQLTEMLAG